MDQGAEYTTVRIPADGHYRLDPLPTRDELSVYYQSAYYDQIKAGGRAPDIKRQLEGGEDAARDRDWLAATLYRDVADLIVEHAGGRRVLEVGCGIGLMLDALVEEGFDATGVEPSREAVALARSRGAKVEEGDLSGFIAAGHAAEGFDAVVLINVLEHVPDPEEVVQQIRSVLRPGGVAVIRVPNDFSELQEHARAAIGSRRWWVAVPDHIHYFNFESLPRFLDRLGMEVVHAQADFPMELFLLMGWNYVDRPGEGADCHRRRVQAEMALPAAFRRSLYQTLAAAGVGRNCMVVARASA